MLTKKLPSFEGVAPGQTATCRVMPGYTYHQFLLSYSGTSVAVANIDELRLIANGRVIQRLSGVELNALGQFDGRADADIKKVAVLDATRYGLRTRVNEELTAIPFGAVNDPNPITNMTLEADISGSAPSDFGIEAKAVASPRRDLNGKPAVLKQVRKFGYDPAGSGEFDIPDLPRVGSISRIAIHSPSAAINALKLSIDSFEVFNRTTAENEAVQIDGGRVPQSGWYVFDTTENGNGNDFIPLATVSDFRLTLDMAGAGHVDVIVDYLAALGR